MESSGHASFHPIFLGIQDNEKERLPPEVAYNLLKKSFSIVFQKKMRGRGRLLVIETDSWPTFFNSWVGHEYKAKRFLKLKVLNSALWGSLESDGTAQVSALSLDRYSKLLDGDRFNSCQVIYSQFGLAIHQNDHQARCRFVEWAQNEIAVVPDFHKRILFSEEVHLWLNGYVNKQNCRIWSEANPQVYVETPLHPEKLTVWCALWAGGILLQKR
ncbi:transposase [Trichonephila clavipes]|nr:transposase [Trichonephila clavipes]